jgi:hypothetical protein
MRRDPPTRVAEAAFRFFKSRGIGLALVIDAPGSFSGGNSCQIEGRARKHFRRALSLLISWVLEPRSPRLRAPRWTAREGGPPGRSNRQG